MGAAFAPIASAQLALHARTFVTTQPNQPMSLPNNERFALCARLDDRRAFLATETQYYLSDGDAIYPVMPLGTQIPGQPAGVIWSAPTFWDAAISPIDGRGCQFFACATGPGIGPDPRIVRAVGFPRAGAISLVPDDRNLPHIATRTGLEAFFTESGLAVGPVQGSHTVTIPFNQRVTGFSGRLASGNDFRLNQQGAVAGVFTGTYLDHPNTAVILATRNDAVRAVATASSPLRSDRGSIPLNPGLTIASCPTADGSVFVLGSTTQAGQPQSLLWRSTPSEIAAVIAATGDRAPGTEPGVTFTTLSPIGANPRGSFLFSAFLEGPGITAQNNFAYFLHYEGRIVLVARRSPDAPLPFDPDFPVATLLADDTVGIITHQRAVIFTPRTGTITVAQTGRPLALSIGIPGIVNQIQSFAGMMRGGVQAGSEEAKIPYLSSDGQLFLGLGVGNFGAFVSIGIDRPNCPSDFNNDSFTDFFDYDAFVTCFEGGACPEGKSPDFNTDDFIDFFDYSDFVDAFERGC